tara:strand:+ start:757 stop:1206 length:450 start_codon:yes stop_codon:yes gene_type:complete
MGACLPPTFFGGWVKLADMKHAIKSSIGLVLIGLMILLLQGFSHPQIADRPVIKKLPTYRGDTFPSFAEFRVQGVEFDQFGVLMFKDHEPYDLLVNVDYISKVHRYEDAKKTDYSCLMYFKDVPAPILVRMEYKEVYSAIRKASEAKVK